MTEVQQLGELYFEQGIYFFELSNYSLALNMWKKCFDLCQKENEIIDILERCFIFPNLFELKNNYKKQSEKLQIITSKVLPKYEELTLEVIFVQEDIWYILDKLEKKLYGPINISKEYYQKNTKFYCNDEYTDIIMKDNGFLSCIEILVSVEGRTVYNIVERLEEWCSILKIPNIISEYFTNMVIVDSLEMLFEYFHKNTQVYLPRGEVFFQEEEKSYIKKNLEKEHAYRISKEGRNENNILLSICIPSYNRGTIALQNVMELLKMPYDSEIEIIVSNNGSIYDKEGYREIASQEDGRIIYFEFEENQHLVGNFWKVIELAKGKYIMILSDEDRLVWTALPHYFKLMKDNPQLGVIRGNNLSGSNSYVELGAIYAEKGEDALNSYFLTGNYISGIIYKTEMLTDEFIFAFNEANKDNLCFYLYPHMCLDLVMLLNYDFCKDDVVLFINGEAVENEKAIDWEIDKKINFPKYSSFENRILQHYDWIKLLNQIDMKDKVKIILYWRVCEKLFFAVSMIKALYKNEWDNICIQLAETCAKGYDKLEINNNFKNFMQDAFIHDIILLHKLYN